MRTRVLCAALSTLLLYAAPAAADVAVTTTADTTAVDGQCSLREALAAAGAHASTADCSGVAPAGTTTVTLPAGIYGLTGGALEVGAAADVALSGAGGHPESDTPHTLLQAGGDRLLTLAAGGRLALSRLALAGGRAPAGGDGGAILSAGDLEISDATISDARAGAGGPGAAGGDGGAIASTGTLSLSVVDIAQSEAGDGGPGVAGGPGGDGGDGGAIFSSGPLAIDDTTISEAATGQGGRGGDGVDGAGAAGGDGGAGGEGGAIASTAGGVTLEGVTLAGVRASSGGAGGQGGDAATRPGDGGDGGTSGPGGALAVHGGPTTIEGASVGGWPFLAGAAHVLPGGAGGAPGTGGTMAARGGDGGAALGGGAIAILGGQATLTDSTIAGADAGLGGAASGGGTGGAGGDGGALLVGGGLTATNVTLAGNSAGSRAGGVWSSGAGTVVLRHVTATGNTGSPGSAGTFEGVDALSASIVVAEGGSPSCVNVGGGAHNLAHPAAGGCPGATVGDPRLADELDWNGGPAATLLLGSGSAAIDLVPAAGCPAADERGFPRPQGAACDAGAVEAGGPPHCDDLTAATPFETPVVVRLRCTTVEGPGGLGLGVGQGDHGTVEWAGPDSDSVVYTPAPGFSGTDTIQYYGWTSFGGFSPFARITVTVGGGPGGQAPVGPPSVSGTSRTPAGVRPLSPNRPLAPIGTTRLPLLAFKAKQKGKAVKGVVNVAAAGSKLDATLTVRGKGKKGKPVVVGHASARKLAAGPYALSVKLNKKHGLPALRAHRSLEVVLTVAVTSPSGGTRKQVKTITLAR